MPELDVKIAGRSFQVTCQPGQEHFLRSAASLLDAEAVPLVAQMARLTDAKMLLMAGLMVADKTAGLEDELRTLRARVAELETRNTATSGAAAIPPEVMEALGEIAARAEAVADLVDEKT